MPLSREAVNTIVRFGDQAAAIRQRVLAFIDRSWGTLDAWHDADIERFVRAVVPIIQGAQVQTASLTDAYLSTLEGAVLGRTPAMVGIPADVATGGRGVPTADVYRRTGPTVWRSLAAGAPLAIAVGAGLARARSMAETDLQLTRTHTTRHILGNKSNVSGFQRVIAGDACSLCTGSSHRYGKSDLMPIHNGCSCGQVPVYANGPEPGDISIGTGSGSDRGTPVVEEHGELGPVLATEGEHFLSL